MGDKTFFVDLEWSRLLSTASRKKPKAVGYNVSKSILAVHVPAHPSSGCSQSAGTGSNCSTVLPLALSACPGRERQTAKKLLSKLLPSLPPGSKKRGNKNSAVQKKASVKEYLVSVHLPEAAEHQLAPPYLPIVSCSTTPPPLSHPHAPPWQT